MIGKQISHYHILEKLGEGGMGIVYKAKDTRLNRTVALKFLPPELTRDPEAKARFIREAQAASALDHPNICTIHEIDETADGQLFIVMACYEGQTLKQMLNTPLNPPLTRGETGPSPLPVDKAIDIMIQIAGGLAKAHEKGIVHRDIKPANILITNDGIVKILDFGLAKLAGQAQLTKDSSTLGTVAYMSPEQLSGKEVDRRTDIWSLGVVLYEMIIGHLPFEGDYEAAIMYSVLNERPESLTSIKNVPHNIREIVNKSLEKNQEDRWQSIQEFLDVLKHHGKEVLKSEPQHKSIVVLPFINMSPDPEQDYFSDGLTEEIITDLSHIHDLLVISRSSTMTLKGTNKTIPEIARAVNVQYVLEGSVRKAGNSLRITSQLIDAENDVHLWAEKFSGSLDDIFDIQEKVSRSIADALKLKLSPDENRKLAEKPIDDVRAYECYLKAYREIWRFTEEGLNAARQYLENGLDIIGDNPYLYAALASVYWHYANLGIDQNDSNKKAESYAKNALRFDPDFPKAHTALGFLDYLSMSKLKESAGHFKHALAVNPSELEALHGLAIVFTYAGRFQEASSLAKKMLQLDPLNPISHMIEGVVIFFNGQFKSATEKLSNAYFMDPENRAIQFFYASSLARSGRTDEAITIIDRSAGKTPDNIYYKTALLLKYGLLNDRKKTFHELSPAYCKYMGKDNWAYFIAVTMALLDEKEEAMDWLEKAVDHQFQIYPFMNELDPFLDNIRGEARFKKLMERVKYEWENFQV